MPHSVEEKISELESLEILGATRQLHIVADALNLMAERHDGEPREMAHDTLRLAEYLTSTRGQASQAIGNALNLMLEGLEEKAGSAHTSEELRLWMTAQVKAYKDTTNEWVENIAAYGANLLSGRRRVVAYDYSSSVAYILKVAAERGEEFALVVPESRILDGGAKYIPDLEDTGFLLEMVPDAAISALMRDCDLVLEGAETLSAEGGCYNTTGTLQTALAAKYWGKPFYVASTLIKLDVDSLKGHARLIPSLDVGDLLLGDRVSDSKTLSATCPELDYTPPELITGFVTEVGILPPPALWHYALRFSGGEGDADA